jgi:hypothetical protein
MKRFFNIGMAVLALFLTWDLYDVDNEPIDPAQIAEHRVYIRSVGELEPTLAATVNENKVPIQGLGWGNKKHVSIEFTMKTGEVSPRSEELQRIQPRGGDKGVRVIEQ